MAQRFFCPLGHAWEEYDLPPGRAARCPACGATGSAVAGPAGRERGDDSTRRDKEQGTSALGADGGPTVSHPDDWQPLSPPGGEVPPTLADFDILSELGRGGMGVVYKARWRSEDEIVAVKVIRQDRLQHDEAVRRFRREAEAAKRMHHPNIVRVLDSDHVGDTHYLVMEYVEGETLEALVAERGPMAVSQACDFVRQAAQGLQHAHERALVHRDIKPSNLMVTPSGDARDGAASAGAASAGAAPAVLKILDMGVARLRSPLGEGLSADSFSTLTHGGSVIGTADYVAPEQLEDPHGADIRADLYSLGCTFYFLLTGQVPFPGGSLVSKLDKQRWEKAPEVAEVRGDVPAAVASVVRKLLAKQPADRFRTPQELALALEDLARGGYAHAGDARRAIEEIRRLGGQEEALSAVAFSPDGAQALGGGKDRYVRLWNLADGAVVRAWPKQTQEVRALAIAPDGKRIAWAAGVAARIGRLDKVGESMRLGGHTDAVRAVSFAAAGERLVTAAEDKTVRLWDAGGGREIQRMTRHTAGVTCCAVDAGGSVALSGGRDQTLRLWDLRNGQELRVIAPNGGTVLAVALTADGRLAVSAHFDMLVRLWDVQAGKELRRFHGHKQMVAALALTPDGKHLLTGSPDQTLRLWQVSSGLELASIQLETGVTALSVAPSGAQVLVAGADRSLRLLALPLT